MARLDQELVRRGLADSRARAQEMIAQGLITVDGAAARKASQTIMGQILAVAGTPSPWVSRAALKLTHALDHFNLTPRGAAADIGASTGGFTQVLLARGAARVIAVDVGNGQLHPTVAADPRVEERSGTNARHLEPGDLPPLDWVVSDVSFISATKALGPTLVAARQGARLVCLIKPQFELSPADVGKGGIVKAPAAHARAIAQVGNWLQSRNWTVDGQCESPVRGSDGNAEFLLVAQKRGDVG